MLPTVRFQFTRSSALQLLFVTHRYLISSISSISIPFNERCSSNAGMIFPFREKKKQKNKLLIRNACDPKMCHECPKTQGASWQCKNIWSRKWNLSMRELCHHKRWKRICVLWHKWQQRMPLPIWPRKNDKFGDGRKTICVLLAALCAQETHIKTHNFWPNEKTRVKLKYTLIHRRRLLAHSIVAGAWWVHEHKM